MDITEKPIVVGTDGSDLAAVAVRWAVRDAARRGLPVRIVHVVDRRPYGTPAAGKVDPRAYAGERMLDHAARTAGECAPDVAVATVLAEGAPGEVLSEEAAAAAELVVGCRGRDGCAGALLGSVPVRTAGHAPGAVVVVRPEPAGSCREVVVGADGSAGCEPALAFAFEQARARGCPLRAVHAWREPQDLMAGPVRGAGPAADESARARCRPVAERIAAWRERFPDVEVREDLRHADPVPALVDASGGAELLVVGARGLSAVGSLLLGSVSRGVLHHAHCPVAVVR
ncbi:universal stress protein [Planomonospora corallina]|uniref:Universal stress protein n=1 Tax=Planomonospora corallina TaxID=1806052 RepID=A0ABV8I5H9_9ACTN